MPGPKHQNVRSSQPNAPLMEVLEATSDDLECPSTEGYVTARQVKVRTIEGISEETEYSWTKKGLERWLAACPKVLVFLKTDDLNDGLDISKMRPHPVYIDSYRFDVRKGVAVWVPKPIAEIIENMQATFRTAQSQGVDIYKINDPTAEYGGLEYPSAAVAV